MWIEIRNSREITTAVFDKSQVKGMSESGGTTTIVTGGNAGSRGANMISVTTSIPVATILAAVKKTYETSVLTLTETS